jgi:hypothetical protein
MEPRYHARDVAWMRAQEEEALLIVSSAHLSLETCGLEAAEHLLKAPGRPHASPQIEVVDLRRENPTTLLSAPLPCRRLVVSQPEGLCRRAGLPRLWSGASVSVLRRRLRLVAAQTSLILPLLRGHPFDSRPVQRLRERQTCADRGRHGAR